MDVTFPTQFGNGEKAGGSQMICVIQTLLEANPGHVALALVILTYVGLGKGHAMVQTPFVCKEGVQQGTLESGPTFTLCMDDANNATNTELQSHRGVLLSRADDTYIIAPPDVAFATLVRHCNRIATVGMQLNFGKTKCYIATEHHSQAFHVYRRYIVKSSLTNTTGISHHSITAYGIPIGSPGYVFAFLDQRADKTSTACRNMHPREEMAPKIPDRKCLWVLTLRCL